MLIDHDGRFKARIVEAGVAETGPNKLVTFTAQFEIVQEFVDGEWQMVNSAQITGYFYLEKRDGSINTFTIDALCEALGWDGRDPFWLQDTEFGNKLVQLTVERETYEGTTRPKIRWINHADAEPSAVKRADNTARTAIVNRIGSKLRANAGGTPRQAPAPTSPKSTTSTKLAWTADSAWNAFLRGLPENYPVVKREEEWFRILDKMFPGKEIRALKDSEWQRFIDEGLNEVIPF